MIRVRDKIGNTLAFLAVDHGFDSQPLTLNTWYSIIGERQLRSGLQSNCNMKQLTVIHQQTQANQFTVQSEISLLVATSFCTVTVYIKYLQQLDKVKLSIVIARFNSP